MYPRQVHVFTELIKLVINEDRASMQELIFYLPDMHFLHFHLLRHLTDSPVRLFLDRLDNTQLY